jgi:cellulose biosynthesis protein BcsQ
VDSADIDTLNDQRTIFRYQKAELIYKQILSVYSEKASSVSGLRMDDDSCKEIIFASACGGVGTSSLAAACASHFAAAGKRTLYLNLEKFGTSASFFGAEGQFDMSDVVFAVKSKKANLALKLESCVRRDRNGVFFYAPAKIALDMMELGKEDIVLLLTELRQMGSYDYIVVDADFSLDKDSLDIYRKAHGLVMVSDGSDIANEKTVRAYTALATLEQNSDSPLTNRTKLIYNRFSSKTGKMIDKVEIQNIGGMPRFAQASVAQVLEALTATDAFDQIAK